MITTQSKALIASQIKTSNLISYTFIHDQVQTNFKLIAQALLDHDHIFKNIQLSNQKFNTKIQQLSNLLYNIDSRLKDQQTKSNLLNEKSNNLIEKQYQLDKKLQNLINDFDKLKQSDKAKTSKQVVLNPQDKKKSFPSQVTNEKIEKLMKITNAHQQIIQRMSDKFDKNQKDAKNNQNLLNKQIQTLRKQIISIGKASDAQNIWRDINKLKEQLEDYCIKDELQNINNTFKQQQQKNNNKLNQVNQQLNKVRLSLDEQKRLRLKNSQQLWKVNEIVFKLEAQKLDSSGIDQNKFIEMQKDLYQLKKKINFVFNSNGRDNDFNNQGHKTVNVFNGLLNTETKTKTSEDLSPSKSLEDQMEIKSSIKTQLLNKMKQQKQEMMKAIKKADYNLNQNDKNKYVLLQDALQKLYHLVNNKADLDSVKKLVSYIENKVNYIFQMISNSSEQDALIARKNWFCLSCDKKIDHYKGKVGAHISSSQQMKGQQLRQQVTGDGISIRSKSKVDLPSVFKGKK